MSLGLVVAAAPDTWGSRPRLYAAAPPGLEIQGSGKMADDEARARYHQACEGVRERGEQFFEWRVPGDSLLTIALDHLTLGRAHLGIALTSPAPDFTAAAEHLSQAVAGLRQAGDEEFVGRGLLARATFHRLTANPTAARTDLTEAEDITTRGRMRLHETDAHLEWTRLHLQTGELEATREHLGKARALVKATGYSRRRREVAWLTGRLAPI